MTLVGECVRKIERSRRYNLATDLLTSRAHAPQSTVTESYTVYSIHTQSLKQ